MSNRVSDYLQYQCTGFPAVVGGKPRVLILGSMPGRASLQAQQYYAHPRNAFWYAVSPVTGVHVSMPYAHRCQGLVEAGLALWDVCRACVRKTSLDSDIRNPEVNDFVDFFVRFPSVHAIVFNGTKAESLFERLVKPNLGTKCPEIRVRAPSTSPANARLPMEAKITHWRRLLTSLLADACPAV